MKKRSRYTSTRQFDPILPGVDDWPVVKLSKNRKNFVQEVITESIKRVHELTPNRSTLKEELETTMYRERLRIKQSPWLVDPDDENAFWKSVKKRLVNLSNEPENEKILDDILYEVVSRYAEEIAGNFKKSSYRLARSIVAFGFSRLLNAARVKKIGALWSDKYTLHDKINITGELQHIRELAKIGTVVMVPTHFSNLDSILIGWVIHTLGLPPFIYGAGLNLFNISIIAYFMNSLGAYKVDRRKRNIVYLETLKMYSNLAIQKGCHSLFFPGGTRSRSGRIEDKLKLGLLGTALEAQRINLFKENNKKIFIFPVVLNYHFVLEAPVLINEYLSRQGQERYYVDNDRFSTSYKIIKFLLKFFTKGSDISVSIGKGMDLFGNYVNDQGESIDKSGRVIDITDYFKINSVLTEDKQRETEYVKMLGDKIVQEYHRINRVFSSHLVAFTAFEILKKRYPKLDLYSLLRLPEDELMMSYEEFKNKFLILRNVIFELHEAGKVNIASHLKGDVDKVIEHGIDNVGMYHAKRPLLKTKQGYITTQDLNTLFYYHNRMEGYELDKHI